MQALQTLSTQMGAVSDEFMENLESLSRMVAASARPMSSTSSSFSPHSNASNPATVSVNTPSLIPIIHRGSKSDLYSWREIFQLYVDTEVFESHSEKTRGERSVEDAESRLILFKQRLVERGYVDGHALKLKQSKDALQSFLDLNSFILDLKKASLSNAVLQHRNLLIALILVPICHRRGHSQDTQETCEANCATGFPKPLLTVHAAKCGSHTTLPCIFFSCALHAQARHLTFLNARTSHGRSSATHCSPHRRLRVCHLHEHCLQANPPPVRSPLLRSLSRQDAEARKGQLSNVSGTYRAHCRSQSVSHPFFPL